MQTIHLRARLGAGESAMTFLTGCSWAVQGKPGQAAITHDIFPGVTVHTLQTPPGMDILGQAMHSSLGLLMSPTISQHSLLKKGVVVPLKKPMGIGADIVGLMTFQTLGIRDISGQSMDFGIP